MLQTFNLTSFVYNKVGNPDKTMEDFLRSWGEFSASSEVYFQKKLAKEYHLYKQRVKVA